MMKQIISASALAITLSVAGQAQPPEDLEQEMLDADVMMDLEVLEGSATSIEELPGNVESVQDVDGELLAPYERAQRCSQTQCSTVIINMETGSIAFADGEWQAGYVETFNGDQVVHVRDLNDDTDPS